MDIRDFAVDKHRTVDDTAYGGGAGMIMMAPPVVEAVEHVRQNAAAPVILTTPQGDTVYDMGQNMVGWCRLAIRGCPAGRQVALRHLHEPVTVEIAPSAPVIESIEQRKSTLLRLLNFLEPPTRGQIRFMDAVFAPDRSVPLSESPTHNPPVITAAPTAMPATVTQLRRR